MSAPVPLCESGATFYGDNCTPNRRTVGNVITGARQRRANLSAGPNPRKTWASARRAGPASWPPALRPKPLRRHLAVARSTRLPESNVRFWV
jgi:hypothetical protein